MGVRMIVYIDSILLMGDSLNPVESHLEALIFILTNLGLTIQVSGLLVNSTSLHLNLSGEKLHHIRMEVKQLLHKVQATACHLVQITGKLNAASQAVLPAPLFYHSLQGDLQRGLGNNNQSYNALLSLSPLAKEELSWWQEMLGRWNGKALLHQQESVIIRSDASLKSWGAVCNGIRTGGPWSQSEQQLHVNCLELLAATLAVKSFLKDHQFYYSWTIRQLWLTSGNCVAPVDRSSQSLVAMGSFQGHYPVCRTCPGTMNCTALQTWSPELREIKQTGSYTLRYSIK